YFFREADGFGEGNDDFVVMSDVVFREGSAFAVFEPFLAYLIAADVKVPDGFGNAFESGGLGLVDPDGVLRPGDFFDFWIAPVDEFGAGFVELVRFQEVERDEFAAEPGQCAE